MSTTMHSTSLELRGDREILIERTFAGPTRTLFDAFTRPELVRRWWGAVRCEADVRVGGRYLVRIDSGPNAGRSTERMAGLRHGVRTSYSRNKVPVFG